MRSWSVKLNIASFAQDLHVSTSDLEGFAAGTRTLPTATLKALTKILYQDHAFFDPALDRLRTNQQEATAMGIPPDPYRPPANAPRYQAGGAPPLYPAGKPRPRAVRPGWA